jgi:O-antigen/teichoic acid export membrane protein
MNNRIAFVGIGLAVNLLMLVRGVVMMSVLDYADLGLVALVQACILFGGMLHFGLLNGGYRLLCHAGERHKQRIIDLAYTGFAALAAGIAIAALIAALLQDSAEYAAIAALTAGGGIATLLRSWMMNEMVAARRLKAANLINAGSMASSLALLVFLPAAPALVAVGSIVIQPVLFAVLALASGSVLRPRRLRTSRRLTKVIFRTGFVLFLTGIAIQFNSLIERTYISSELGLEPLGRLYLAFLFLTLFQMAPNLLQQVFLPVIVGAWKEGDADRVRMELGNLLTITLVYCVAAAAALWLVAPLLLEAVLPKYVDDLHWVYLLAPGLIAFTMSTPFALMFNVVIEYRWYLVAYGAGSAATLLAFAGAIVTGETYSLDGVIILRSAIYGLMAAVIIAGWWQLSARHRAFRIGFA